MTHLNSEAAGFEDGYRKLEVSTCNANLACMMPHEFLATSV